MLQFGRAPSLKPGAGLSTAEPAPDQAHVMQVVGFDSVFVRIVRMRELLNFGVFGAIEREMAGETGVMLQKRQPYFIVGVGVWVAPVIRTKNKVRKY